MSIETHLPSPRFSAFSAGAVSVFFAFALGALAGSTFAALCDETYHLQTATQYVYTTQNPMQPGEPTVTELRTDLADMKTYLDSTELQFLVGFEGACGGYTAKPLHYLLRQKADRAFKSVEVQGYSVRMFDSNTTLSERGYGYWFGFSLRPDTLAFALGMPKDGAGPFTAWYGLSVVRDSTRNTTSGLWSGATTRQVAFPTPDDESHTLKPLQEFWKDLTFDANHQGTVTFQLIKITYDSKPTAIRDPARPASPAPSVFSARQNGGQVKIRVGNGLPGQASAPNGSALVLFDMFGHRVAQLHPIGQDYFWNGVNRNGAAAPSGVYFAERDGRVVGKFMYSR